MIDPTPPPARALCRSLDQLHAAPALACQTFANAQRARDDAERMRAALYGQDPRLPKYPPPDGRF
jgi:hypothetical protein